MDFIYVLIIIYPTVYNSSFFSQSIHDKTPLCFVSFPIFILNFIVKQFYHISQNVEFVYHDLRCHGKKNKSSDDKCG